MTLPTRRTPQLPAAALLLACCWLAGCRIPTKIGVTETGAPSYDRATVVYELNGAARPLPLRESVIAPAKFVAEAEERPASNWSSAKLSIQYPHPDGSNDMARAVLRLSSLPPESSRPSHVFGLDLLSNGRQFRSEDAASSAAPTPDDELWVLDIPKQQLDILLLDLASSGFSEQQLRNDAGAKLDVQLDWGRTQKSWTAEPKLDQFVARVYREGRLGGFVPCDAHRG